MSPKSEGNYNILIVDEEPFNRMSLTNILGKLKTNCYEADNINDFIDLVKTMHFDLAFIDSKMSGIKNSNVSDLLFEYDQECQFVAMGVEINQEDLCLYIKSGFSYIMGKSYSPEQISQIMQWRHAYQNENKSNFEKEQLFNILGNDKEFIRKMIDLYIDTAISDFEKILHFYKNSDFDDIREIAHKMSSPAGQIGATWLYQLLKSLEKNIINQNNNSIEYFYIIACINYEIKKVHSILKAILI